MVHTVTRFCTNRANCRIEQSSRKGPLAQRGYQSRIPRKKSLSILESNELRREFDGVSNPHQACDDWIPNSTKWRASSAMCSEHSGAAGTIDKVRLLALVNCSV